MKNNKKQKLILVSVVVIILIIATIYSYKDEKKHITNQNTKNSSIAITNNSVAKTINSICINNLEEVWDTAYQNENYDLPKTVIATMSDGSEKDFDVTWETNSVDTSQPDKVLIEGTVKDYSKKAQLYLTIEKETVHISEFNDIEDTVEQYGEYAVPQTIKVKMSDNTEKEVPVKWNTNKIDTSNVGEFNFQGTIDGVDDKVNLKLTVEE